MANELYERASEGLFGAPNRLEVVLAIIEHENKEFRNAQINALLPEKLESSTLKHNLARLAQAGVLKHPKRGQWEVVKCDFWDYCERLRDELDDGTVKPPSLPD